MNTTLTINIPNIVFTEDIDESSWAQQLSEKIKYDNERKVMLIFDNESNIWQQDNSEFILTRKVVLEFFNKIIEQLQSLILLNSNDKIKTRDLKRIQDSVFKWRSVSRINKIIEAIKFNCNMPFKDIIKINSEFLHFKNNKSLNLKTFEVLDTNKDLYAYQTINADYNPDADCPKFIKFLNEIFIDDKRKIDVIQRWLGYSLLSDNLEQKFLICYGDGCNGKSVLFDTIAKILNSYCKQTSFTLFEDNTSQNDFVSPQRLSLIDARSIFVFESSNYCVLNTAFIKQITGEDTIAGRYLYSNEILEFKINGKIVFVSNHLPVIHDDSNAIWRRLIILKFVQSFIGRENKNLKNELLQESSGIINWIIEGLKRYYKEGLNVPNDYSTIVDLLKMENNNWMLFVDDECELDKTFKIEVKNLYNAYKLYCAENNYKPLPKFKFINTVQNYYKLEKKRYGHNYDVTLFGIKLKSIPSVV